MSSQTFGKYQLLRKLATGGMAEVWLAKQTGIADFQRNVVVKRILPHLAEDAEFIQMFLNEAKIAARFAHPNIAQIYDLGRENNSYFIAMEYIHGEDLGRIMRKAWSTGQWLTKPLAIRIIAEACEGLHYAHSQPLKVVHRDVSPQNILVSFEGSVKLVDFGIAKAADQASLTRSGAIKGKFAYMSPEQASGKPLDHRSDIFALGLVLYELLTGVRPIKRENDLATLQAALECAIEPPSAVSDVPADLDPVVMRALAKSPDERYRDARQFQVALEEVLSTQRRVATSVQISELMTTLFADRLAEEARAEGQQSEPALEPELSDAHATEKDVSPPEMEWEAPPGPAPKEKPLERTTISRPEVPVQKGPAVDDWVAPPGPAPDVLHKRREGRAARGIRTMGPAKTPSSPNFEATSLSMREEPLAGRGARPAPEEDPDATGPRPPTPRPMPLARRETADPPSLSDTTLPPVRMETPKPHYNGISRKPLDMMKADAKALEKLRPPDSIPPPVLPTAQPEVEHDQVENYVNLEELRAKSRKRFQVLLYVTVSIAVVILLVLFRQPILEFLNQKPIDSQGVLLTVVTNEPVDVYVRHTDKGPDTPLSHLGSTASGPIRERPGAHAEDVIILENRQRGIHYEETIPYGQPGQIKVIQKEFLSGWFHPVIIPKNVSGLAFYLGNNEVGKYSPTVNVNLVEGEYDLELRGPKLKQPVPVHVKVVANKTTDTPLIDLKGKLGQ